MKKMIFLFCFSIGVVSMVNAQTPAPDTTLQAFTGKYLFPEGSPVTDVVVSLDNGALISTSSAGVSGLEKIGEDLFSIVQFQGTAKFNRDANKKVIGVSIKVAGFELEGTKTESIALSGKFNQSKEFQIVALIATTR